jgi:uncharacterized membrane protein
VGGAIHVGGARVFAPWRLGVENRSISFAFLCALRGSILTFVLTLLLCLVDSEQ